MCFVTTKEMGDENLSFTNCSYNCSLVCLVDSALRASLSRKQQQIRTWYALGYLAKLLKKEPITRGPARRF